ncbi:hypothetical protein BGZ76_011602 [Entomortierella beljakovae]|nr:hypothetical protein BGZ76_011602 [Entomortierella beljakovae]
MDFDSTQWRQYHESGLQGSVATAKIKFYRNKETQDGDSLFRCPYSKVMASTAQPKQHYLKYNPPQSPPSTLSPPPSQSRQPAQFPVSSGSPVSPVSSYTGFMDLLQSIREIIDLHETRSDTRFRYLLDKFNEVRREFREKAGMIQYRFTRLEEQIEDLGSQLSEFGKVIKSETLSSSPLRILLLTRLLHFLQTLAQTHI